MAAKRILYQTRDEAIQAVKTQHGAIEYKVIELGEVNCLAVGPLPSQTIVFDNYEIDDVRAAAPRGVIARAKILDIWRYPEGQSYSRDLVAYLA